MSEKNDRRIILQQRGMLSELANWGRLVVRLMLDRRVNLFLKLLPLTTLAYLISPLDLAIGPLDDAAVIWLGLYLFVELCPPQVVREHLEALNQVIPGDWQPTDPLEEGDEIVEAEFRTDPVDESEAEGEEAQADEAQG